MGYKTGSVNLVSGSSTVNGNGTSWLSNIAAGDIFVAQGDVVSYVVGLVVDDTTIILNSPYTGVGSEFTLYNVVSNATANRGYPFPVRQDIEPSAIFARALKEIDEDVQDLVNQYPINFEGAWASDASYTEGDIIVAGDFVYISLLAHTSSLSNEPPNATYWRVLFSKTDMYTINWKGDWVADTDYTKGTVIRAENQLWIAPVDITGVSVFDSAPWDIFIDVVGILDARDTAVQAATDASNTYDTFRTTYYGALADDPTVDPLGNPITVGDLYTNTTSGNLRIYRNGAWEDSGASTATITERTLTAGQTSITGLAYTPGFTQSFINGGLLFSSDITAADGTTATLTEAANDGDEFVMLAFGTFDVANVYTKAEAQDVFEPQLQHNDTAITDPGPTDDSSAGYSVRSNWINTSTPEGEVWRCLDNTAGAAVWVKTTLTLDELGVLATKDNAAGVPITDVAGHFAATDVEAALAEEAQARKDADIADRDHATAMAIALG